MLSTLLNLSYLSTLLALIVAPLAGIVALVELFKATFQHSVFSARRVPQLVRACFLSAVLAMIGCFVIAGLHLLIGGGINAH